MIVAPERVWRLRPGEAGSAFGLWPEALRMRDERWEPGKLPALLVRGVDGAPQALALWTLLTEGLVLFGPYGDLRAAPLLVDEAIRVARDTGQAAVLAPVANDEVARFELLQRLGFVLVEARPGALADASPRSQESEPDVGTGHGTGHGTGQGNGTQGTAADGRKSIESAGAIVRIPRRDELVFGIRVAGATSDGARPGSHAVPGGGLGGGGPRP